MGLEFMLCPLFGQASSPTTSTGVPSDRTSPVESAGHASLSPASAPLQDLPDLMGLRLETMPYDYGSCPFNFQQTLEMPETIPAFGSSQSFPAYLPASFSAWHQIPEGDYQWIPDGDLQDGLHFGLAPSLQPAFPCPTNVYEIRSDDEPTLPEQPQAWACLLEIKMSSAKRRNDCLGFSCEQNMGTTSMYKWIAQACSTNTRSAALDFI